MTEAADPALLVARFFAYGLALLMFGAVAFEVYAPAKDPPGPIRAAFAPLLSALAFLAYAVLLAREAGGGAGWPPPSLLASIYAGTGFGRALAIALVSAFGLALVSVARPRARWPRLGLSALALAALAFVGHAADSAGGLGAMRLATMALHLLAIGAWLGALPLLWRALSRRVASPPLLGRFGLIGGVCVALVVLTGLGSLGFMLADAKGRLGAGYARVLILKLGFVLALFVLAAVNRFRLTPMLARDPKRAARAMRLTIVLEQLAGLGALASVALLGQLDPNM
ncbi:MAG TPA: CopD family protein [Caulobacteraceae bacterium]|nr:CopD family protein [Caulobacteraceae bacterium]